MAPSRCRAPVGPPMSPRGAVRAPTDGWVQARGSSGRSEGASGPPAPPRGPTEGVVGRPPMESKRSHHRVRHGAGAMLVTLCAAEDSIEGEVLDLTVQGSGGRFPESGMPQVTPGERVRLEF